MGAEVHDRPVGILFHTSESDIWPLEEAFNEKLRDSSQNLLRYLRRNRVYHYLIDRFGRVYRVVEEEDKANHAGHLGLERGRAASTSTSTTPLGVSLRDALGGRPRAAHHARPSSRRGRSLTDYLRHKWDDRPATCA